MPNVLKYWHRAAFIIVIGALLTFGGVIFFPEVHPTPETVSLHHAQAICVACRAYALANGNQFPPGLDTLFPKYLNDRSILVSPLHPDDPVGYTYTDGLKPPVRTDTVLIEDKYAPGVHRRIVSYADGSARVLTLP